MKKSGLKKIVLLLVPLLFVNIATHAAPPAVAQDEINHLLKFLGESDCQFNRNGSWYDSKKAEAHLRGKYDYLAKKDLIHSAKDFIEQAASKSSRSGKPYQMKCKGGAAVLSRQWLSDELARYRAIQKK